MLRWVERLIWCILATNNQAEQDPCFPWKGGGLGADCTVPKPPLMAVDKPKGKKTADVDFAAPVPAGGGS